MTNIFFFVLNHPKKVLFCIALVTYLFALSIVNLKYDFTIEQLFAKDKEETEVYFEFQKDFSREDNVFLLVHQVPGKISYSFIDSLSQIASALNKSSYFIEVISLADIYNDSNKREHDYISSKLLNMVSKDSTHGSIWLKLKDDYNTFKKRSEVIDFLKSTTRGFDWEWTYSGIPVVRNTYVEYMIKDNIKFIPPVALILVVSLAFLFRHWLYVILPLFTVLITACWILGIMSITGKGLNVMTYMVPTLLFIIGVSDSIHLLSRLNIYLRKNLDMKESLELSMKDMGFALFLTSLTTAIGFLALLYSSISIVQEFGIFIACGVFLAYVLTLTFIPSVLILLKDKIHIKALNSSNIRIKFLKNVSNLVNEKPKQIALVSIFLTLILSAGTVYVSTGSSLLSDLHPQSGLYKDLKNVEKWFGGILPMEIIVTKDDSVEIAMHDSLIMSYVQEFQEYVSDLFPHSNWISLQKVLKQVLYEISPQEEFPPDQETLDQLYILTQDQTESLINFEETKIRISGMLPDLSSEVLDSIEHSLEIFADNHFPPWLSINVTGTMPVALKTNNYLVVDLFSGFGLAFIFISLVMGLLFLSVRIGLLSMLPNLIPIIFAAGYLGFAGIPIRPPIAITFSICLGIAVDDSLHFLFRFWQERKDTSDLRKAVSNTIETTGLAMLTTTIVLVSGFLVITVSTFIPTAQFGIISAITLSVAFITDITLLPALLIIFPVKFFKEKNHD
jgi:predicted RND superfamily exporter protein